MINPGPPTHDLDYYISESQKKGQAHREWASHSLKWHNFTNIISTIITASSALAMTILTVMKYDEGAVAITSGVFTFLSLVFTRVSQSYNFQLISSEHHHVSDAFLELVKDLSLLDPENLNIEIYNLLVAKYIEVVERSHIPPIRSCFLLECC